MIDLKEEQDSETKERPPQKWRPWWLATQDFTAYCTKCQEIAPVKKGYFTTHCRVFPSKDTAETFGLYCESHRDGRDLEIRPFVGAWPDGEGP